MNDNILITERISKLFVSFVIPSVAAMVLVGIQGMIDGIFLGNFENTNAMASVNIANPYMQLILGSTFVICTGTLSYLGRTLGEKDIEKSKKIFRTAVLSVIVSSAIIAVAGIFFHDNIAQFLGANSVLLSDTSRYILILALFAPVISFMLLCGFMGRLIERPHLYLIATISCLIGNIIMNYVFIKILRLGVTGAALSTGLSYFIGLIIVICPLLLKSTTVNIYDGKFQRKILKDIVFNGSSEGVNYIATALILFLFNKAFMDFAGEDGVAAFTVINYIGNFATILMFGISDGIGSILSCNYGAGKSKRVHKTLCTATFLNLLLGVLLFIIINLFSESLIHIFMNENIKIINMAVQGAKIYAVGFLFNGFNIVQSGYHTSLGNALASVIIAASRGIIFIVTGIIILPNLYGLNGIWLIMPFAEVCTVVVCLFISFVNFLSNKRLNFPTTP